MQTADPNAKASFVNLKNEQDGHSISFVVTGFGKFGGVSDNPTTVIVQRLQRRQEERQQQQQQQKSDDVNDDYKNNDKDCIILCKIIKTAASSVTNEIHILSEYIQQLETKELSNNNNNNNNTRHVVFIHLGVDYKSKSIKLETTAYNEASFRIPDEEGYQPKNIPIDDTQLISTRLSTSLNVKKICTHLNNHENMTTTTTTMTTTTVTISGDPGRFVCNYLYWSSLNAIRLKTEKDSLLVEETKGEDQDENEEKKKENMPVVVHHALFVHVPLFSVIDQESQVNFIDHLMDTIQLVLATPPKKKKKKKKN